jgi:hypothetical protein
LDALGEGLEQALAISTSVAPSSAMLVGIRRKGVAIKKILLLADGATWGAQAHPMIAE